MRLCSSLTRSCPCQLCIDSIDGHEKVYSTRARGNLARNGQSSKSLAPPTIHAWWENQGGRGGLRAAAGHAIVVLILVISHLISFLQGISSVPLLLAEAEAQSGLADMLMASQSHETT